MTIPIVWGVPTGNLKEECASFVECIINDTKPLITGEDGLEAVKLAMAIYESAEKEKVIRIEWQFVVTEFWYLLISFSNKYFMFITSGLLYQALYYIEYLWA